MLLKVSPDGKVSHCRELLRVQWLAGTCVLRHANDEGWLNVRVKG